MDFFGFRVCDITSKLLADPACCTNGYKDYLVESSCVDRY